MKKEVENKLSLHKIINSTWKQFLSIVFILGLLFMCRYQPALSAAPGVEEIWVTKPGLPAGYLKTGQIIIEYRPCTFELLGWEDDSLFYQSNCRETIRFWQYKVGQSEEPKAVTAVPANLTQTVVPNHEALEMVRAYGVRPVDKEFVTRRILLEGDGLASPDGQWTAVIVQHLYAPQDILLVTFK